MDTQGAGGSGGPWEPPPSSELHTCLLNMLRFPPVDGHLLHDCNVPGTSLPGNKPPHICKGMPRSRAPGLWELGLSSRPTEHGEMQGLGGRPIRKWEGRPSLGAAGRTWADGLHCAEPACGGRGRWSRQGSKLDLKSSVWAVAPQTEMVFVQWRLRLH